MQYGSIAGKVVSNMVLLKSIRKDNAYCYNNQENMRGISYLGKFSNFLIKQI
jgi:hypothetical protein